VGFASFLRSERITLTFGRVIPCRGGFKAPENQPTFGGLCFYAFPFTETSFVHVKA
jgi:hypothetical protein